MPTGMNSPDQLILAVILGIVAVLVLVVDFVIFCYWIAFKYKEYSFEQTYGPIITFPPREADHSLISSPEFDTLRRADSDEEHVADDGQAIPQLTSEAAPVPMEEPSEYPSIPEIERSESEPIAPPETCDDQTLTGDSGPAAHPADAAADPLEDLRPIDALIVGASGGIRSPFASTWSLVHPFVAAQVVLTVVNIFAAVLIIPAMFSGSGPNVLNTPYGLGAIILSLFVQNVGFVGITAYLLKGYGTSLKRIGLRAPSGREVMLGLVYGAGLCIAAVLLEKGLDAGASHVVSKEVMDRLGKVGETVSAGAQFEKIHSVPLQIWFMIAGAVAAPIGEEVFFRGLLYNGLKKRWGIPVGVIISAICFALIHVAPLNVIIIIPMGCILAIVYERTKSLWVTILMHAVNNGAQLAVAMYAMNHVAAHK